MIAAADRLWWWTQISTVGCSPSADIDDIADTVTPNRPAGPSVVTTLTHVAARLMPSMNRARISGTFSRTPMSGMECSVSFQWASGLGRQICALLGGVLDAPDGEPLIDGAIAGGSRCFAERLFGQAGGFADEVERPAPFEVPIDRRKVGERGRLREQLEGEPMPGIVRVQEIARKGEQAPPVIGDPVVIDGVEFFQPRLGFGVVERRFIGRDADLTAAELAGEMHHLRQLRAGVHAPGIEQGLVRHHEAAGAAFG